MNAAHLPGYFSLNLIILWHMIANDGWQVSRKPKPPKLIPFNAKEQQSPPAEKIACISFCSSLPNAHDHRCSAGT